MIEILHHDPLFIVVNKPTGVLTISTFGVPSLQTILRQQLAVETDAKPFVEPPHRLDRGTSGNLLIARTRKSLSNLSQQFHHRQVRKKYLIAVDTRSNDDANSLASEGTFQDWIRKIPDVSQAEVVTSEAEGAKLAVLHFRKLYGDNYRAILEIEMQTGRMHQIRLQFASRGYPILGDKAYGSTYDWLLQGPSSIGAEEGNTHAQHTALHAAHLAFRHPKDASWVIMDAPVPTLWTEHFPSIEFGNLSRQFSKPLFDDWKDGNSG